jgi:hypothetical protein
MCAGWWYQPLELWGREGSPFVALVREALCSMELPYRYYTVPFGSDVRPGCVGKDDQTREIGEGLPPFSRLRAFVGLALAPSALFPFCQKRSEFRALFGKQLPEWRRRAGLVMVPLLLDPNTGVQKFESRDILLYLRATYQVGEAPYETVADYSTAGAGKDHGVARPRSE